MICLRKHIWHRSLITLTTLISMLFVVSSCGTPVQTASNSSNSQQIYHGNVAIFTPADGLALTRNKPLSTWDRLVPELVKKLKNKGFNDNSIVTKTSSSLSQQSQDVQDYVVNLLTPLRKEKHNTQNKHDAEVTDAKIKKQISKTTIVIAPWTSKNGNNNYGDYATLPAAKKSVTKASNESTDNQNQQNSEKNKEYKEENSKNIQHSEQRLAASLRLAQKFGMHIVMISRCIPNFKPDVLFHLSDASSIGEIQAATLVQKLALDRATKENPRYIEVLLPCHNQVNINIHSKTSQNGNRNESENTNDGNAYGNGLNNTDSNGNISNSNNANTENQASNNNSGNDSGKSSDNSGTLELEDDFAKEAFAGIWKVLRPYFVSGTLLSTSGRLHANSTEKDWINVAFDANDSDAVKNELKKRITRDNNLLSPSPMHVDGIIALDDQVALQTVQTLNDLGYEGSAANINPSFTLPDVIGNFIGKRNLTKRPVPAPKNSDKQNNNDDQALQKQSDAKDDSRAKQWPAITGYGAYKNVMPNIVSGKQWMTTIEHQNQITSDITEICDSLNVEGKLSQKIATTPTLDHGITVPTVREQLLAVSATNLKSRLIDPGYVSLADAGL